MWENCVLKSLALKKGALQGTDKGDAWDQGKTRHNMNSLYLLILTLIFIHTSLVATRVINSFRAGMGTSWCFVP